AVDGEVGIAHGDTHVVAAEPLGLQLPAGQLAECVRVEQHPVAVDASARRAGAVLRVEEREVGHPRTLGRRYGAAMRRTGVVVLVIAALVVAGASPVAAGASSTTDPTI